MSLKEENENNSSPYAPSSIKSPRKALSSISQNEILVRMSTETHQKPQSDSDLDRQLGLVNILDFLPTCSSNETDSSDSDPNNSLPLNSTRPNLTPSGDSGCILNSETCGGIASVSPSSQSACQAPLVDAPPSLNAPPPVDAPPLTEKKPDAPHPSSGVELDSLVNLVSKLSLQQPPTPAVQAKSEPRPSDIPVLNLDIFSETETFSDTQITSSNHSQHSNSGSDVLNDKSSDSLLSNLSVTPVSSLTTCIESSVIDSQVSTSSQSLSLDNAAVSLESLSEQNSSACGEKLFSLDAAPTSLSEVNNVSDVTQVPGVTLDEFKSDSVDPNKCEQKGLPDSLAFKSSPLIPLPKNEPKNNPSQTLETPAARSQLILDNSPLFVSSDSSSQHISSINMSTAQVLSPSSQTDASSLDEPDEQNEVLIPKGTYNIDWDNFDESKFNPFGNTPPKSVGVSDKTSKKSSDDIHEEVSGTVARETNETSKSDTKTSYESDSGSIRSDSCITDTEINSVSDCLPKYEPVETSEQTDVDTVNSVSKPQDVDDIPVAKGSYNIDWDNIDVNSVNPFGSSSGLSKMAVSPTKNTEESSNPAQTDSQANSTEDSLPQTPCNLNISTTSTKKSNSSRKKSKLNKKNICDNNSNEMSNHLIESERELRNQDESNGNNICVSDANEINTLLTENNNLVNNVAVAEFSPSDRSQSNVDKASPSEYSPAVKKGSYTIDFDNVDLDSVNPFATKSKIEPTSLTSDSSLCQDQPEVETSLTHSTDKAQLPSSPVNNINEDLSNNNIAVSGSHSNPEFVSSQAVEPSEIESCSVDESVKVGPSKSSGYNIDWDNVELENLNPFATKSKMQLDSQNTEPEKNVSLSLNENNLSVLSEKLCDSNETAKKEVTSKKSSGVSKPSKPRTKFPKLPKVNEQINDDSDGSSSFVNSKNSLEKAPKLESDTSRDVTELPSNHEDPKSSSTRSACLKTAEELAQFGVSESDFRPGTEVFNDPNCWDVFEKASTNTTGKSHIARQSVLKQFDPFIKDSTPTKPKKLPANASLPPPAVTKFNDSGDDLLQMNTPPVKDSHTTHPANPQTILTNTHTDNEVNLDNSYSEKKSLLNLIDGTNSANILTNGDIVHDTNADHKTNQDLSSTIQQLKLEHQQLKLEHQAEILRRERDLEARFDRQAATSAQQETEFAEALNFIAELCQCRTNERNAFKLYQEKFKKALAERDDKISELERKHRQDVEDLNSVETAFSDLHRRYEKSKEYISSYERNQCHLQDCLNEHVEKLQKAEDKYQDLVIQSTKNVDNANAQLEATKRSTQSEITRLSTAVKCKDIQISNLEQSLQQKTKEIKELTSICDELLAANNAVN